MMPMFAIFLGDENIDDVTKSSCSSDIDVTDTHPCPYPVMG